MDLRQRLILNDMSTMVAAYKIAHARLAAAGRRPEEAKNREALARAIVRASKNGSRSEAELVTAALAASIALRQDRPPERPVPAAGPPPSAALAVWQKLKRRLSHH